MAITDGRKDPTERLKLLPKSLRLIPAAFLVFLVACGSTPSSPDKVRQNFTKIKPGMTRDEVESLMGKPAQRKDIGQFVPQHSDLACTDCELWVYLASEGDIELPQVAFDTTTGKVTQTVKEESDKYFNF